MRLALLIMALALRAGAVPVETNGGGGGGGSPTGAAGGDLSGTYPNPTLAATQSNVSTITLLNNGAKANTSYPNSSLMSFGNANTYFQWVLQNLSNGANASGDFIITDDLGGDTSFYLNLGINSSKFSQAGFSAQSSSDGYVVTSDSNLHLWADTNGALNGGGGHVIIGSSVPNSGNKALDISSSSIVVTPSISLTTMTASSATITNLTVNALGLGAQGTNSILQDNIITTMSSQTVTINGTGSSLVVSNAVTAGSMTTTGTGNGNYALTLSTSAHFYNTGTGILWADGTVSTSVNSGAASAAWNGGSVTNSSTFTAQVTLQNTLSITGAGGISIGSPASTLTISGIPNAGVLDSSFSISGATSTSGSATYVYFSTRTLAANSITQIGQTINIRCRFQDGGTVLGGTDQTRINIDGVMVCQTSGFTGASVEYQLIATLTEIAQGLFSVDCMAFSSGNGTNTPSSSLAANINSFAGAGSNYGNPQLDPTAAHSISCVAEDTGAGAVSFLSGPHINVLR